MTVLSCFCFSLQNNVSELQRKCFQACSSCAKLNPQLHYGNVRLGASAKQTEAAPAVWNTNKISISRPQEWDPHISPSSPKSSFQLGILTSVQTWGEEAWWCLIWLRGWQTVSQNLQHLSTPEAPCFLPGSDWIQRGREAYCTESWTTVVVC